MTNDGYIPHGTIRRQGKRAGGLGEAVFGGRPPHMLRIREVPHGDVGTGKGVLQGKTGHHRPLPGRDPARNARIHMRFRHEIHLGRHPPARGLRRGVLCDRGRLRRGWDGRSARRYRQRRLPGVQEGPRQIHRRPHKGLRQHADPLRIAGECHGLHDRALPFERPHKGRRGPQTPLLRRIQGTARQDEGPGRLQVPPYRRRHPLVPSPYEQVGLRDLHREMLPRDLSPPVCRSGEHSQEVLRPLQVLFRDPVRDGQGMRTSHRPRQRPGDIPSALRGISEEDGIRRHDSPCEPDSQCTEETRIHGKEPCWDSTIR